jgi:hypothetical protein
MTVNLKKARNFSFPITEQRLHPKKHGAMGKYFDKKPA